MDSAVTRTTGFFINVLSSSQIPKNRVSLLSERYCVSNWVVLIHPAPVHDGNVSRAVLNEKLELPAKCCLEFRWVVWEMSGARS